jgi:hypothetical protein
MGGGGLVCGSECWLELEVLEVSPFVRDSEIREALQSLSLSFRANVLNPNDRDEVCAIFKASDGARTDQQQNGVSKYAIRGIHFRVSSAQYIRERLASHDADLNLATG